MALPRESRRKLGLMGCGAIAVSRHVPAIHQVGALSLHAVFDPNPQAQARARALGVEHVYGTVDAFFDSGVELVSVASSAPSHRANVLAAAARGLPVLCEKPLAMSEPEATELIEAMRRAGAPLYTAFCYRFSPSALRIRELVRSRAVGDVRALRLIYNWGAHGQDPSDGRRLGRMDEGGPLVDCGTHQIDLARFWLESEVRSYSGVGAWIDDFDVPDHLWLHMDHENGAHSVVEVSYSYHHNTREPHSEFLYELIGSAGVIRYERATSSFTVETARGTETLPFHPEKNFVGMYEELATALGTGTSELLATAEDGLRATAIAQAATAEAIRRRLSAAVVP